MADLKKTKRTVPQENSQIYYEKQTNPHVFRI